MGSEGAAQAARSPSFGPKSATESRRYCIGALVLPAERSCRTPGASRLGGHGTRASSLSGGGGTRVSATRSPLAPSRAQGLARTGTPLSSQQKRHPNRSASPFSVTAVSLFGALLER
ncbi:hypothetical protein NDU88_001940 [Pleurodeles waltl]|uniref:Uncharacterized protein n=1 Tax=Pleurodeles waltl TaxID=8319 RepID=A0AAV7Q4I5_PLEWA|nr:hypothetical protein NDU88_001940 [Pleurodeles waltl]